MENLVENNDPLANKWHSKFLVMLGRVSSTRDIAFDSDGSRTSTLKGPPSEKEITLGQGADGSSTTIELVYLIQNQGFPRVRHQGACLLTPRISYCKVPSLLRSKMFICTPIAMVVMEV